MLTFLAPPRPWKGGFLRDAAAEGRLPRAFPFPSAGPLSLLSRLADLDATNRTGIALVFPDTSPRVLASRERTRTGTLVRLASSRLERRSPG